MNTQSCHILCQPMSTAPAPTNAPAPSGGLFGSTPAPSGGLFGSNPAPAPSGGLFGSTTAPAASGGLFGSTTAAPSTSSLFGTPAPSTSFGAALPTPQQPSQQQPYVAPLSGSTPYSQLPPHIKNAVDDIYRQIMSHRRTLASVKTMAPSLLESSESATTTTSGGSSRHEAYSQPPPTGADIAAGSSSKRNQPIHSSKNSNLSTQLKELHHQITQDIAKQSQDNNESVGQLKQTAGELVATAKLHGLWPIETIATRRQVILSSLRQRVEGSGGAAPSNTSSSSQTTTTSSGTTNTETNPSNTNNLSSMPEMDALALQHIMDMRAASVDRKELIPSPYYWEVLRQLEKRGQIVATLAENLSIRLNQAQESERFGTSTTTTTTTRGGDYDYCHYPSFILCDTTGTTTSTSFPARCAKLARIQNDQFLRIAEGASRLHEEIEVLKSSYRRMMESSRGMMMGGQYEDPFFRADVEEMRKEREVQQKIIE